MIPPNRPRRSLALFSAGVLLTFGASACTAGSNATPSSPTLTDYAAEKASDLKEAGAAAQVAYAEMAKAVEARSLEGTKVRELFSATLVADMEKGVERDKANGITSKYGSQMQSGLWWQRHGDPVSGTEVALTVCLDGAKNRTFQNGVDVTVGADGGAPGWLKQGWTMKQDVNTKKWVVSDQSRIVPGENGGKTCDVNTPPRV